MVPWVKWKKRDRELRTKRKKRVEKGVADDPLLRVFCYNFNFKIILTALNRQYLYEKLPKFCFQLTYCISHLLLIFHILTWSFVSLC